MDSATWFVIAVAWIAGAALAWVLLYSAVRLAVLHALRTHTMSSTAAVSVVSAIPLQIAETPAETR